MRRARVRALLDDVAQGKVNVDAALASLDAEPIEALAHTTVDHHRALRSGYPEVVFGEGKTSGQVVEICRALAARSASFLVTRASTEHQAALVRLRGVLEQWIEETNDQGRVLEPPEVAAAKGATRPAGNPK